MEETGCEKKGKSRICLFINMIDRNILNSHESPDLNSKMEESGSDPRALRLQQMRQAQKLLKEKRKQEIIVLREENENLRHQIKQFEKMQTEYFMMLKGWNELEIPQDHFHQLLEMNPPDMTDVEFYTMDQINELIGPRGKYLYTSGGDFFLRAMAKKYIECMKLKSNDGFIPKPKQNMFRLVEKNGLSMMSNFHHFYVTLAKDNVIPKKWIHPTNLPENFIGLLDIAKMLAERFEPDLMIMALLSGLLIRFGVASNDGLIIDPKDVDLCLEWCAGSDFDQAYILGKSDGILCEYIDDLKVQLIKVGRI